MTKFSIRKKTFKTTHNIQLIKHKEFVNERIKPLILLHPLLKYILSNDTSSSLRF